MGLKSIDFEPDLSGTWILLHHFLIDQSYLTSHSFDFLIKGMRITVSTP